MNTRPVSTVRAADWPDTLPSFYRSEAFAEDLHELVAPLPQWREDASHGKVQGTRGGGTGASDQGQELRKLVGGGTALPGGLRWQGV